VAGAKYILTMDDWMRDMWRRVEKLERRKHHKAYSQGEDPSTLVIEAGSGISIAGAGTAADPMVVSYSPTDTGWVNITPASGMRLYDAESVFQYRRRDQVVQIRGELQPATQAAADLVGGTSKGQLLGTLPAAVRPTAPIVAVMQGSGENRWTVALDFSSGELRGNRYGSVANPSTGSWMPLSFTYLLG
jgi:hypothetical protein